MMLKIYKYYYYFNSIKVVIYNICNVLFFLKFVIVVKIIYTFIINNLLYKISKIFIFIVINLFKLYF